MWRNGAVFLREIARFGRRIPVGTRFGMSKDDVFDSNVYYGVEAPASDLHALTVDPKLTAPGQGAVGILSLTGYRLQQPSPARKSGKFVEKSGGQGLLDVRGNRAQREATAECGPGCFEASRLTGPDQNLRCRFASSTVRTVQQMLH